MTGITCLQNDSARPGFLPEAINFSGCYKPPLCRTARIHIEVVQEKERNEGDCTSEGDQKMFSCAHPTLSDSFLYIASCPAEVPL
jgi:hypothetical protein